MLVSLKNNKYSSGESLDVENEFFFYIHNNPTRGRIGNKIFPFKKKNLYDLYAIV